MASSSSSAHYVTGPTFLLFTAIAYNAIAERTGHPTISTSIRWASRHPFGAWIAGGIIGGLLAHWFLGQESTSP